MVLTVPAAGSLVAGSTTKEVSGMKVTRVRNVRPFYIRGNLVPPGTVFDAPSVFAIQLITASKAVATDDPCTADFNQMQAGRALQPAVLSVPSSPEQAAREPEPEPEPEPPAKPEASVDADDDAGDSEDSGETTGRRRRRR